MALQVVNNLIYCNIVQKNIFILSEYRVVSIVTMRSISLIVIIVYIELHLLSRNLGILHLVYGDRNDIFSLLTYITER